MANMEPVPPPRLLLFAATTGYQIRSFAEAARRLGISLTLATDRCHVLEDPWGDHYTYHENIRKVAGKSTRHEFSIDDRVRNAFADAAGNNM